MDQLENKIPSLYNGLGIYLMFLLSGNSLKSGTDKISLMNSERELMS